MDPLLENSSSKSWLWGGREIQFSAQSWVNSKLLWRYPFAGLNLPQSLTTHDKTSDGSGSEKGVFWKRGLFRNVLFLKILENLEIPENPQTVGNKGGSDQFLEITEFMDF